jgi:alpha-beta hydrolase superfamily lysophospholipase/SAM-dependent methyltransferase
MSSVGHDSSGQRPAGHSTEHSVRLTDGTELFYRAWIPDTPTDRALVLFHRGHEHSGRWQESVEALGLDDIAIFAWDARGHGCSPGDRGSAENLSVVVNDIDQFVKHLSHSHGVPVENMVVLAHSVGAVTATAWVHDYAPRVRALILATPAFRVRLYVPFAVSLLRLRERLLGSGYVKSYVKARMLTHDPDQARQYHADPLIFRQIAVNILLDLYDTSTRLMADAGAITVPVLLLTAESDWVVKVSAQRRFFAGLASPVKRITNLPGFYHAVFHEKDRHVVIDEVRDFVRERFGQPPSEVSLVDSDKHGYTQDEYERLQSPGSPWFAIVRLAMKTLGRLSGGVRLGWDAGFDSGLTLDYVYENRARGTTLLGRAFDRAYLNTIGWRGIRVRRRQLESLLRVALEEAHRNGPVRLLDIASGPGRYVLDTVRRLDSVPVSVRLRDYQPRNVDAARHLADEFELPDVTVEQGDAFDRESLAGIRPRPNVAVVSGLYELYPDNERVLRSLRGLGDAIEPGGYLIYTNQPWHPQVEFIARVLVNRENQPWIMRRRTQAEMDQLVRTAGFEKVSQLVDPWGIFTVSMARRVSA